MRNRPLIKASAALAAAVSSALLPACITFHASLEGETRGGQRWRTGITASPLWQAKATPAAGTNGKEPVPAK
jgi:hypothetical protein